MLWLIIGVVILSVGLVPLFLGLDDNYTRKKCKYCGKSIKIESAKCRYCKKYLLGDEESS